MGQSDKQLDLGEFEKKGGYGLETSTDHIEQQEELTQEEKTTEVQTHEGSDLDEEREEAVARRHGTDVE
ncbi:MAG: hypothetical protein M3220_20370 [Chloroflexota bacterium]|nr:hypothetical protein [Chloroflexota bacterium]